MKKLLVMVVFFTTFFAMKADAQGQGGGDPAARAARMKEVVKPQLIEKVKLTEAQAEKVIDINLKYRSEMRGFRDMSEDERKKKKRGNTICSKQGLQRNSIDRRSDQSCE